MAGSSGRGLRLAAVLFGGAALTACATAGPHYAAAPTRAARPATRPATPTAPTAPTYKVGAPYQVGGIWYVPREQPDYDQTGIASWYGDEFHMKATANGELFDKDQPSAAHTTLPLPSLVEVTNLDNGRKLVVRVNDRGPFVGGRIIDLSHEAARELGYDRQGLARVRVRYLGPAPLPGEDSRRYARYAPPAPSQPATAAPPPPPPTETPTSMDVVLTSAPMPKAESLQITEHALAPLVPAAPPVAAPLAMATASAPAATGFRVQAGAFSSEANAQRAVAQLAQAGAAVIEPVSRNGTTLYRVVLAGASDQDEAEALRAKAAEAGFADARVIRPF